MAPKREGAPQLDTGDNESMAGVLLARLPSTQRLGSAAKPRTTTGSDPIAGRGTGTACGPRPKHPTCFHAFLVLLHTGMRASQQCRLRWPDVDLARRTLTIRKQKNSKSGQHIPLSETVVAPLKAFRQEADLRGPVFLNLIGAAITSNREWFDPAVDKAMIADYTWHSNRQTFASRLAMAGVDIRTIAQLMGHSTIQITMRYAQLSPDHNQAAVNRLVGFGAEGTPKRTPGEFL